MTDVRREMESFLASVERRAYRMAFTSVRGREDALDIVQDAMFRFADRYETKPAGEWKPLFYRTLSNAIKDHLRKERFRGRFRLFPGNLFKRDEGHGWDPGEAADDKGLDPASAVETSMAMDSLDHALRELPDRQREAFLLRAWEGLSVSETATAMTCSEGSVKTHYHRAVKALRQRLETT